ncbi:MAG: hypothetical protein AAF280_12840 [Pseudomonadota bacterium]
MAEYVDHPSTEPIKAHQPAIHFLAEAALKTLAAKGGASAPQTHDQWVHFLCNAVLAEGDVKHELAITQLMGSGASSDEVLHVLVPAVARRLGEMWVGDEASFVDVTIGSSRLQNLFQMRDTAPSTLLTQTAPNKGDAVLMVVPEFEQHTLGAFVAADEMRRAGIWARIGLLMSAEEVCDMLQANHFAMLGLSVGSRDSVERAAEFVNYIRRNANEVPPVVISGNVLERLDVLRSQTGADFVVSTVREAIDCCGLKARADQERLEADAQ